MAIWIFESKSHFLSRCSHLLFYLVELAHKYQGEGNEKRRSALLLHPLASWRITPAKLHREGKTEREKRSHTFIHYYRPVLRQLHSKRRKVTNLTASGKGNQKRNEVNVEDVKMTATLHTHTHMHGGGYSATEPHEEYRWLARK